MPPSRFPTPQRRPDMLILGISCFHLGVLGQRPGFAEPAQPDHGAESAHDDDIHFSQQYAGQDHEIGGHDARVQVQLPADEGRSLVCRNPDHMADISYFLCSNVKGKAIPASATAQGSKTEIMAYLKGSFEYCDGVYSGFTDAHLNDPGTSGVKTNKMFLLTQLANHDALHYGNLVTYLRLNGLAPSGGWF